MLLREASAAEERNNSPSPYILESETSDICQGKAGTITTVISTYSNQGKRKEDSHVDKEMSTQENVEDNASLPKLKMSRQEQTFNDLGPQVQ